MLRRSGRALFVARNRSILLGASNRAVGKGLTNPNVTSHTAYKADPEGTGPIPMGKNQEQSKMYNQLGNAWDTMRKVGQNGPVEKTLERYEDRYQHEGTGQASPSDRSASGQHSSLWERAKEAVSAVKDAVSSNADRLKQQASETQSKVSAQAAETTDTLGDKFQAAKENLMDKYADAKDKFGNKLENAKEAMGNKLDDVKEAAQSRTVQSSTSRTTSRSAPFASYTKMDTSRSAMTQEIPLSEMQGNLSPEDEVLAPMAARSHRTTAFKGIDNVIEAASTEDLSIKARQSQATTEVKRPTLRFKPEEPTAEDMDDEGLDVSSSANNQKYKLPDTQQWRQGLPQSSDSVGTFKKEYNQGSAQEAMQAAGLSSDRSQTQNWSSDSDRDQQKWASKGNDQQNWDQQKWDQKSSKKSSDRNLSRSQERNQDDDMDDDKDQKHNLSSADNKSGRLPNLSKEEFEHDRCRNGDDGFGNIQNTSAVRHAHRGEKQHDIVNLDKENSSDKQQKYSNEKKQNFSASNKRQESNSDSGAFNMGDAMMSTADLSGNNRTQMTQDNHKEASQAGTFDHQRGHKSNFKSGEHPVKEAARKTGEQLKEGWKDMKEAVKGNLRQDNDTKGDEGLDRHRNEKPQSSEHGERNARVSKKDPTRFGDWEHTGRTTDF